MDIFADENVEPEWIQALRDDGHDVLRVVDHEELRESASDTAILATAVEQNRVVLTADQADFGDPPLDDHSGIVIIASGGRTGGELRQSIRLMDRYVSDFSGHVAYVSDWL